MYFTTAYSVHASIPADAIWCSKHDIVDMKPHCWAIVPLAPKCTIGPEAKSFFYNLVSSFEFDERHVRYLSLPHDD